MEKLSKYQEELKQLYAKMDEMVKYVESEEFQNNKNKYYVEMVQLKMLHLNRSINILECIVGRLDGAPQAQLHQMNFGEALEMLLMGEAIRRSGWNGKGLFVIKQNPAYIEEHVIPNMQSLPQKAKDLILANKKTIYYQNQCLIYNTNTGCADSWVPSVSDMFANDWEIVY